MYKVSENSGLCISYSGPCSLLAQPRLSERHTHRFEHRSQAGCGGGLKDRRYYVSGDWIVGAVDLTGIISSLAFRRFIGVTAVEQPLGSVFIATQDVLKYFLELCK